MLKGNGKQLYKLAIESYSENSNFICIPKRRKDIIHIPWTCYLWSSAFLIFEWPLTASSAAVVNSFLNRVPLVFFLFLPVRAARKTWT